MGGGEFDIQMRAGNPGPLQPCDWGLGFVGFLGFRVGRFVEVPDVRNLPLFYV